MDKSWKAFERRIAKRLGGVRRGSNFRGDTGGKDDIIHEKYSVECKLLGRPTYSSIQKACEQAEKNAEKEKEPIVVIKKKHDKDDDSLVIMRLETWEKWRL